MRKFRHPEESKKIFDVLSGMAVDEAKEAVDDCYMTLLDMRDCAAKKVYLGEQGEKAIELSKKALKKAERSDKFQTFCMCFCGICWMLIFLIHIIVEVY